MASLIPTAIIGGVGLVYIIGYIGAVSDIDDIKIMFLIVLGNLLFYVMLFILPEHLVLQISLQEL